MMTEPFVPALSNKESPVPIRGLPALGMIGLALFSLIDHFMPSWVALGIGPFSYLVVPATLIISLLSLMMLFVAATALDESLVQMIYAGLFSYLVTPLFKQQGWLGSSAVGEGISYLMLFIGSGLLLNILLEQHRLRRILQFTLALGIGGWLASLFWQSSIRFISAAGWLG